jgi:hypothetical protein
MSTEIIKSGRPFSEVWDGHMIKGAQTTRGHYSATCNYCGINWKHGKPIVLREHLANHCSKCSQDISTFFARIIGKKRGEEDICEEESTSDADEPQNKRQKRNNEQRSIRNFYKNNKLEKGYSDEIDRSVTKAFVMCNVPFSVIENPWFIDMLKTLQPGYKPPTRQVLSGTLLESELSCVNLRVYNELSKESNCTIGKITH